MGHAGTSQHQALVGTIGGKTQKKPPWLLPTVQMRTPQAGVRSASWLVVSSSHPLARGSVGLVVMGSIPIGTCLEFYSSISYFSFLFKCSFVQVALWSACYTFLTAFRGISPREGICHVGRAPSQRASLCCTCQILTGALWVLHVSLA